MRWWRQEKKTLTCGCLLQQYLQGLLLTNLEQFLPAKEGAPPHPIAFHLEQLEPSEKSKFFKSQSLKYQDEKHMEKASSPSFYLLHKILQLLSSLKHAQARGIGRWNINHLEKDKNIKLSIIPSICFNNL